MINASPFFSIILPTYNRAGLITKAIASVIAQTYTNWELIIVDDGSTDNTRSVVDLYKDERVIYIHQENAERSAARNNGIKHARGKYYCFLDSDDAFLADHLLLLYDFIVAKETPVALIFTDQLMHKDNGEITRLYTPPFDPAEAPVYFICNSIVPGRVCLAREITNDYAFDTSINYSEDADLWFRISCRFSCYHLPNATFVYYEHDDNSVNVARVNAFYHRGESLKRIFKKDEALLISNDVKKKVLSDNYFGIIKHYEATGKKFMAWKTAAESIFKYPGIRLKEKVYLLLKNTPGLSGFLNQ